jgi:hypothetical protein
MNVRPEQSEQYTWPWLRQRWMPALLSAAVLFAAYSLLALAAPALLATTAGLWLGLLGVTIVVCALLGLVGRGLGWYVADGQGQPLHDPQRQGLTGAQLGLLAALVVFARQGLDYSWLTYLGLLLAVGVAGMATLALVAGPRRVGDSAPAWTAATTTGGPSRRTRVAPRWAQYIGRVCLCLGVVSLVRLLIDGTPYFLWGGLTLLAIGVLLPGLVVALGGGREP